MQKNFRKYLMLFAGLLANVLVFAQHTQSSYSPLGLGDVNYGGAAHQQAMGGLGISYGSRLHLNNTNPALLGVNESSIFQLGMAIDTRTYTQGTDKFSSNTGGFRDFSFSLPIKYRKWNMAVGFSPVTSVRYSFNTIVDGPEGSSEINASNSKGGINEAFVSNAFRLGNLMIGAKISYLFGSTEYENRYFLGNTGTTPYTTTTLTERYNYSDVSANIGLAYKLKVSESNFLNLGAFYALEAKISTNHFARLQNETLNGGVIERDTLANNIKGETMMPQRFGFGISYEKLSKFVFGFDFQSQDWAGATGFGGNVNQNLGEAFRLAVGGEIMPNVLGRSYLGRVNYRFGVHYEQTPYLIDDQKINDIGINFGASLPLNAIWGLSSMNVGFTLGRKGKTSNNLIKENYFKINLGFSIQDVSWFSRGKFD